MWEHSPFSQLPTTHLVYPTLYFSHSPLEGRAWAHPSEQREKFQQKVIFVKDLWFFLIPVQTDATLLDVTCCLHCSNYANFGPSWAPVRALKIRIYHLPPVVSGGFTSYHGGAVSIQLSCHQKNLEFYQAKKYYFLSVTYRSVTMFNKADVSPKPCCIHTEKTEMYTHNLSLCQINDYYF